MDLESLSHMALNALKINGDVRDGVSYLHNSVQVLSGRGHGAAVDRWALGHHGDVMVGLLG